MTSPAEPTSTERSDGADGPSSYRPPTEAEAKHLDAWNDVPDGETISSPEDISLLRRIEAQVAAHPEVAAVIDGGRSTSYATLLRRARGIAHQLRRVAPDVGPEGGVGIFLERSPGAVVATVAALASGSYFVPLDPAFPDRRLAAMLEDAGVRAVLTRDGLAHRLPPALPRLVLGDGENDEGTQTPPGPAEEPPPRLDHPGALAYVVFTSGSTGGPKPVGGVHGALLHLMTDLETRWALGAGDRCCWSAGVGFDVSIGEVLCTLGRGGTLVIAPEAVRQYAEVYFRWLADEGIRVAEIPAGFLPDFGRWLESPEADGFALEVLTVGTEAIPRGNLGAIHRRRPDLQIFNFYGPTEATVECTVYPWPKQPGAGDPEPHRPVPIGRAQGGLRAQVVDPLGRRLPPGQDGELWIAGPGLTRGYLGRPAATAEVFVPDPFATRPGDRAYRTGDRVRWLVGAKNPHEGQLEFVGRIDQQLKVRGVRIEPREVEAALLAHPSLDAAAVVAQNDGDGGKRLVAFTAVSPGAGPPTPSELRSFLGERLPPHMIPSVLENVDRLPTTPGGKIDRAALTDRRPVPTTVSAADAPRGDVEAAVANAFAELLLPQDSSSAAPRGIIGRRHDFFELGGHSVIATRLASRLRDRLDVDLRVTDVFAHSTVADLAAVVEGRRGADTPPPPRLESGLASEARRTGEAILPSFAQEGLWVVHQWDPQAAASFNIGTAVRLVGELDVDALEAALGDLAARHEVLRTRMVERGGRPALVVDPPSGAPIKRISPTDLDRPNDPGGEMANRVETLLGEALHEPFDLSSSSPWRRHLIQLGDSEHVLSLVFDHSAFDGGCDEVLARELAVLYGARLAGGPADLPPVQLQYSDYAVWQRRWLQGAALEEQLAYWRRRLEGLGEPPRLFADPGSGPPGESGGGTEHDGAAVTLDLGADLRRRLEAVGQHQGSTLFMTLLAAFAVVLRRWTERDDLAVGSAISGRHRSELEGLLGIFVNRLVLRLDVSGDPSFSDLLKRVRATALEAFAHQDLPFEHLSTELAPAREPNQNPFFQIAFQLLTEAPLGHGLPGVEAESVPFPTYRASLDLDLTAWESPDGGLWSRWLFRASRFRTSTIKRLAAHWRRLLEAAADDPQAHLSKLGALPPEELARLHSVNDTRTERLRDLGLFDRVAQLAHRHPERISLVFDDDTLDWGTLLDRATCLAGRLRALGVGIDTPVALCVERSSAMVVSLLGILGAGGAYVPLDPDYPADRLSYMLENSAAPVLVSQEHLVPRLPAHPEVLRIGNGGVLEGASDPVDGAPPLPRVDPSQVACILYTSGSTGRPKGVELTQLGIARLADGAARRIPVARRVHGQLSTISFDAASLEIWTALLGGGRLVGITRDDSVDPARLRRRLETQGIESLVVPTALFNQLVRQKPDLFDGVESVVVGGERADADVMRATQKAGPRRLYNAYGPTECSTIATWYEVPTLESDATSVPIGQPYDDTDIYVLGRDGRPCPYGVPGELCLGGEGLARGYVGQRAQTAERFVPHPFADGLRLYRTGDLVRFLEGGVLDFLGRVDHQVKIRGFRIEPGEIEAVLGQHRSVEAQSVAVQRDRGGLQRLVAFVVAVDPDAPPTATELRGFLRERLPEFMLPSSFPVLGQLPLTPNGKVDRGALPHFELLVEPEEVVEPRTETERALGAIWTDVLSRERVGVDDNFFELGGHSLLATQVLARMRGELGVDLTLREFFQRPTLAGLAEAVDGEGPGGVAPELKPVSPDADGTLPLSFDQERLWFLDRLEPGTATYLVPLALRLRGDLDTEALGLAFRVLVERHAVLRSRFVGRGGEGRVRVLALAELKADGPLLPHLDAGGESAEALAEAYARKSVDLETGPPFHAALARLGTRDYLFLLTLHHIVVDGESVAVVLQELEASYLRFTGPSKDHIGDPLPPLAVQFTDFAAWQRSRLTEESLDGRVEGWRRRLRGAPKLLELPTDRPRPAVQRHRGALVVRDLGEGLGSDLRDVARSSGTTPFVMALASFKILLSRLTHQRDLVVGSPVAGRELPQLEDLVGFFVGNLVLRTDLTGDPTFAEIVRRTQDTVLDAIADREVPFEKLVEALRPEQARGHHPFYQVTFQISEGDAVGDRFGPLHKELVIADSGSAKLDLSVHLRLRADGGATAEVEYDLDLFDGATVERWLTAYARLLRSALGDRGQRLSHLPMLGDDARRQLRRWNDTDVDLPLGLSIPQLFARQVAARGDAVAVVHGSQVLTYRELEDRSRRLAAALVRRGVGPGDYVGLCMPRSADAMVAMLAILEAGGAYVPLGPEYPEDRLSFMLSDIGASVVVAQRDLADSLPSSAPLAFYDELMLDGAAGPADPPFPAVDGGFPALLVYTSGSTGRPKGVVVPHRAVTRLVLGSGYHDFDPGDRICQASTINFDAATFEIWGALLHGARTVIFDRGQLLDPAQFESEIDRTRADVLFLTTALFQDLARRAPRLLGKLRVVLFGGERCDPKAVAAALQKGAERTVHVYGPSEVTTFTTAQTVAAVAEDAASIPIGHAIANTHLHVVDPVGCRVDIGVDGELWIGGDGVAAGYLNRPAMTAERFVPDPFGERPGQRLYRSGDLVRRLGDGTLDFVGRTDHQIKLRGFRIELGEIEVALARRPEVDGQLAMVREDLVGDPRLAAYVTLRCAADDDVDAIKGTILAGLAAELPEFMLPSTLTVLETFPLTANGKVDRRALPTPEVTPNAEGTHRAPDSALAAAIADIWAETLGVEGVGLDDDFFKLGGHSLLATKTLARLCDLVEMDLPLLTLFESPVLQEFVARIDAELRRTTEGQEALALLEELHGMSDDEAMELLDGEDSAD